MPSRVKMEWETEGLRYYRMVQREYGSRAPQSIIRQRLEREAKDAANQAAQLAGSRLKKRSGRLARQIKGRVLVNGRRSVLEIGVFRGKAKRYAGIQDRGTVGRGGDYPTIRPRRAKALAMPVGAALNKNGSARFTGPRKDRVALTAIYFPNPSNANVIGALYSTRELAEHRKRRQPGLPHPRWLLLRSTDLKPRRFLTDAANRVFERAVPRVQADLGRFLLRGRRGIA